MTYDNYTTNTDFVSNCFDFKFSNDFLYFLWCIICAQFEKTVFFNAIGEVDILVEVNFLTNILVKD